jgi:hypothetical protein
VSREREGKGDSRIVSILVHLVLFLLFLASLGVLAPMRLLLLLCKARTRATSLLLGLLLLLELGVSPLLLHSSHLVCLLWLMHSMLCVFLPGEDGLLLKFCKGDGGRRKLLYLCGDRRAYYCFSFSSCCHDHVINFDIPGRLNGLDVQ